MVGMGEVMSSAEASRQLGVSIRQIQRLAATGALTQVGNVGRSKLIDARSVQRLKARGSRRGRPWTAETIAAAIDLLTDGDTERLSSLERRRLRGRLSALSAEDLVRATSSRADVRRYRTSSSFLDRLSAEVTPSGLDAVDRDPSLAKTFGLTRSSRASVDGYVDEKAARALVRECHMVEDEQGNVTLRVTPIDSLKEPNTVTVALDLADSLDTRVRSAGLTYLRQRLKALR